MRYLLSIVALVIAATFAPQVLMSASNSCDAFERRLIASEASGDVGVALLQKLSGGLIGQEEAKRRFQNLPPLAGCSLMYWELVFKQK